MSLKDLVYDTFRLRQESFRPKLENEIWVSWLSECQYKRELSGTHEQDIFPLIRGVLLHMGIQDFLRDQVKEVEKQLEYPIDVDGKRYLIRGSVDVVLNDGTPVEVKTTKRLYQPFYPQHMFQLLVYMFMMNMDHGLLVYFTEDQIVEYQVNSEGANNMLFPFTHIDEKYLRKAVSDYVNKKRIAPFSECSYCVFRNVCDKRRDIRGRL